MLKIDNMYPNDDQQPPSAPEPSIDYLNQIAPKQPGVKQLFSQKRTIILVALLGAVILSIGLLILNSVLGNSKPTETLAAQLVAADNISSDANSKIKNSQLRATNSNLTIYLTNTIRDIDKHLSNQGVKMNKLNKSVVDEQKESETLSELEDARLNATYDRSYAREMSYRLETMLASMRKIHGSTRNTELKNFLQVSYDNLEPIQQQFADFNATNG